MREVEKIMQTSRDERKKSREKFAIFFLKLFKIIPKTEVIKKVVASASRAQKKFRQVVLFHYEFWWAQKHATRDELTVLGDSECERQKEEVFIGNVIGGRWDSGGNGIDTSNFCQFSASTHSAFIIFDVSGNRFLPDSIHFSFRFYLHKCSLSV